MPSDDANAPADTVATPAGRLPDAVRPERYDLRLAPDLASSTFAGEATVALVVVNTAERPIQVGSHYHFAETNAALSFDRAAAHGMRLNITSGTAVRFEPGQQRTVELVDYTGSREVYGFRGLVQGGL